MIRLSDHFTSGRLLRFTLPSIIMLVFTSVYGVVDGFFVTNFVGTQEFAAVNFIMPFLMVMGSVGFMFGTGGSALIAKTIGSGDRKKANELFSMNVYISFLCGIVLAVIGFFCVRPVASLLGAGGQMLESSVLYGKIILIAIPAYVLQFEFQCLFATAEKPKLGLWVTVAAGCTNIVLDLLFVAVFRWGLVGAAVATVVSQCVGGFLPFFYFCSDNQSLLRIVGFHFDPRSLGKTCVNGSSELMSNISMSVVGMLYNVQLLNYVGENGVSAYGVLMYLNLVFQAVFIGFSVGSAPIVSYHFGAGNRAELKELRRKGLRIIALFSCVMFVSAELLAKPLSFLFVRADPELYAITVRAFFIYSFVFLLSGFSIYGSSFFTALNNGAVSAAVAFLRTLVFQVVSVLIFPIFWELDGIWFSIVAAEVLSACVTATFFVVKRKQYGY